MPEGGRAFFPDGSASSIGSGGYDHLRDDARGWRELQKWLGDFEEGKGG